jgi:hypothetical protein
MDCHSHLVPQPDERPLPAPGLQFLGFLDRFFDAADHVERLFWQVVVVAVEDP